MPEYSWRKDPENPIRIDKQGLVTIVVEELLNNSPQVPKHIQNINVAKDFGNPQEIWTEAMRLLKIKIKPITDRRREETNMRSSITDDMVGGFEDYLNTEE